MSTSQIFQGYRFPQTASPLFSRLPLELRLMIYKFVFLSCYATAWFDGEFGQNEYPWLPGRRQKQFRSGACCFSHCEGGFSLLVTCREAYIEAFGTYWGGITLEVARSIEPIRTACGLVSVCRYLPAAIKENLGDLRNVKLPILEVVQSTPDDPTWTPALLSQLPKLGILLSTSFVLFGTTPRTPFRLRHIDQSGRPSQYYVRLAPFRVSTERPVQFIERKIGVQLSGDLKIISKWLVFGFEPRWCYFNWTTGMMFETTDVNQSLRAVSVLMEAKPGSRWSRWY